MHPTAALPLLLALSVHPTPPAVPADPPAARAANPVESPEARAIADRVIAKYAHAKTYRDTGRGTTTLGPGMPSNRLEFRTAFRRDSGMRWSFTTMGQGQRWTYTVWSDDVEGGERWNTWWEIKDGIDRTDRRSLAFGAAAGISSGLSTIVPDLLGPEADRSNFFIRFVGLRRAGTEEVDGVPCDILAGGMLGGEGTLSVWIDPSGAIRKYRWIVTVDPSTMSLPPSMPADDAARMRALPKFESTTEFTFEPVFDAEVTEEDLRFTPPAK